jgi:hypothetical protein
VQDSVLLISNNGDDSSLLQMRSRCAFSSPDVSSVSVSVTSPSASEFITATAFINEPCVTPSLEIEGRLATTESYFGVLTVAGSLWTQATAAAGWTAHCCYSSVVFDNKISVPRGIDTTGTLRNDVWYSRDGISGTRATAAAGWTARYWHTSVVFDNYKMWMLGGIDTAYI